MTLEAPFFPDPAVLYFIFIILYRKNACHTLVGMAAPVVSELNKRPTTTTEKDFSYWDDIPPIYHYPLHLTSEQVMLLVRVGLSCYSIYLIYMIDKLNTLTSCLTLFPPSSIPLFPFE